MVKEVVNNALGLAQYITSSLNETQAVSYLLAVEGLTIDDWANCKHLLPNVNTTKRQTKEKAIEDVVLALKSDDIATEFLVKDLSILPGMCANAIKRVSEPLPTTLINVKKQSMRNDHDHYDKICIWLKFNVDNW